MTKLYVPSIIVKSYDYDAFGNELNPDPNDTNPFRYCGEYYDTSTGLYNLQARHYSPELGRFTQEDTHAGDPKNPLSLNLYTYCYNDPVQYDDPRGNVPVDTILDFISLCDSAVALCTAPSLAGVAMVALDLAALLLPYVSGTYILKGGKFVEAGEYLDEAVDAVKGGKNSGSAREIEVDPNEAYYPRKTIDYRKLFFEQNPDLKGKVTVHHSIKQQ